MIIVTKDLIGQLEQGYISCVEQLAKTLKELNEEEDSNICEYNLTSTRSYSSAEEWIRLTCTLELYLTHEDFKGGVLVPSNNKILVEVAPRDASVFPTDDREFYLIVKIHEHIEYLTRIYNTLQHALKYNNMDKCKGRVEKLIKDIIKTPIKVSEVSVPKVRSLPTLPAGKFNS